MDSKVGRPIAINKAMKLRPSRQQAEVQKKMKQAAKLYEKMFMREMVKAMRQTVKHSELTKPTMAEKIYQEKIDDKYVDNWSQRGGVGLADIIYQQLEDKFGGKAGIRMLKPQGPVPIEKSEMKGIEGQQQQQPMKIKPQQNSKQMGFEFDLKNNSAFNRAVTNPWSGKVANLVVGEDFQKVVQIDHENGMVSSLSFKGQLEDLKVGQKLAAGQGVGKNLPSAEILHWTVGKRA